MGLVYSSFGNEISRHISNSPIIKTNETQNQFKNKCLSFFSKYWMKSCDYGMNFAHVVFIGNSRCVLICSMFKLALTGSGNDFTKN